MTADRWFFGALVPEAVRLEIVAAMERHIGADAVSAARFAPRNYHQSFSERFFDAGDVAALRRAGKRVDAVSFTMTLDRWQCSLGPPVYWSIKPRHQNQEFDWLKSALGDALRAENLPSRCPSRQHVTLSYGAPYTFEAQTVEPIVWTLDTLMLLRGGGDPYGYEPVEQWPLRPPLAQLF